MAATKKKVLAGAALAPTIVAGMSALTQEGASAKQECLTLRNNDFVPEPPAEYRWGRSFTVSPEGDGNQAWLFNTNCATDPVYPELGGEHFPGEMSIRVNKCDLSAASEGHAFTAGDNHRIGTKPTGTCIRMEWKANSTTAANELFRGKLTY
jgi:hypothetical protein